MTLGAMKNIIKADSDFGFEVITSGNPSSARGPSASSATSKDILKHRKDVGDIHSGKIMRSCAGAAQPFVAELVIPLTFLRIRENFVRLCRFFELPFCLCIIRVSIGMILHRQPPVRAFDLVLRSLVRNAKDLVIVAGGWHGGGVRG